jgi:D-2-hydroxyacid dehydrogenase (NADP+)
MFERMKPSAYFVNVGRGKSVVTDDLLVALKTDRIAGAGLYRLHIRVT